MPFQVKLQGRPAGYALDSASGVEGTPLRVVTRDFTSSEDGELFMERLEGWPSRILAQLPPSTDVDPSTINHLVAIIKDDLTATVYVNELSVVAQVRAARAIGAGEEVRENDIADVAEFRFESLDVPPDAGVLILFSAGWRKGLFFDFAPLQEGKPRSFDLWKLLGSHYAYLTNQSVFRLSEDDWKFLIEQSWFPFISLDRHLLKTLVGRARGRDDLDILVPKVREHVEKQLPVLLDRWKAHPLFSAHLELLEHAAAEFKERDYKSATAILYPRIEGIMRDLHITLGVKEKPTAKALAGLLVETGKTEMHRYSWLLPERFLTYLNEAYFANFEPGQPPKLSRHSLGHGVAAASDFNEKAASIGLLIVDQLFWFLPKGPKGT